MKRVRSAGTRMPHVLLALSMDGNAGPLILRSVFATLATHEMWDLEIVRSRAAFTPAIVRRAIRHGIDGVLLALGESPREADADLAASDLPYVTIGVYPPALGVRTRGVAHVTFDNAGLGREAARSFLAQGRYSAYAYVPPVSGGAWSALRLAGFRRELERRGATATVFVDESDDAERRDTLPDWLAKLPRPAAVLAGDDTTALDVLRAAARIHLAIPDELAVLGVNNEELLCENAVPPLSSVRTDIEGAARRAVEALSRLMRGRPASAAPEDLVVNAGKAVIHRATTVRESTAASLVRRALAFIELNAHRNLHVRDVQEHLRVSRSLLDLRFREVRGESVSAVITDARLAVLRRLLRETDDPIESLSARLEWRSPNYLKNLFKSRYGQTMREYRNAQSDGQPYNTTP